ncbi:hypothetical protein PUNSTDRAFT_138390 [Punctularia strigosozonata HHB-11173 SS5]|uniref:Uncharacterized protein n=1 Tax=Punctularia strigosozonata (strain HHB-11173) TaxID=741275 RepID=R7S302_PUNST|nr:uncharacterized protein PUNSTDRAFT_138390 [Punctularia strigosozonata HHB-11173 SS5]EIN04745.1 hypothetical protein PUNSTDRAFT_138390 [Punctularia strigosozonata HHB-11173 SS5]
MPALRSHSFSNTSKSLSLGQASTKTRLASLASPHPTRYHTPAYLPTGSEVSFSTAYPKSVLSAPSSNVSHPFHAGGPQNGGYISNATTGYHHSSHYYTVGSSGYPSAPPASQASRTGFPDGLENVPVVPATSQPAYSSVQTYGAPDQVSERRSDPIGHATDATGDYGIVTSPAPSLALAERASYPAFDFNRNTDWIFDEQLMNLASSIFSASDESVQASLSAQDLMAQISTYVPNDSAILQPVLPQQAPGNIPTVQAPTTLLAAAMSAASSSSNIPMPPLSPPDLVSDDGRTESSPETSFSLASGCSSNAFPSPGEMPMLHGPIQDETLRDISSQYPLPATVPAATSSPEAAPLWQAHPAHDMGEPCTPSQRDSSAIGFVAPGVYGSMASSAHEQYHQSYEITLTQPKKPSKKDPKKTLFKNAAPYTPLHGALFDRYVTLLQRLPLRQDCPVGGCTDSQRTQLTYCQMQAHMEKVHYPKGKSKNEKIFGCPFHALGRCNLDRPLESRAITRHVIASHTHLDNTQCSMPDCGHIASRLDAARRHLATQIINNIKAWRDNDAAHPEVTEVYNSLTPADCEETDRRLPPASNKSSNQSSFPLLSPSNEKTF